MPNMPKNAEDEEVEAGDVCAATIGSIGGEFALIDRIARGVASVGGFSGTNVMVGIGDDAAVLPPEPGASTQTVVTTDMLIEDVHFRLSYGDFYSLGVKAAAVNLSDIAAMGATPTVAFISLALPKHIPVADLDELYRGMNETFARYGATIAGGDTNLSPGPLTINVTLLGTVPVGKAVLRSTARPGDAILVTGMLGLAASGFALLEAYGREKAEDLWPEAVRAQLRPVPRLAEAEAAVAAGGVTAMMDLSDGLMGDLQKLCRASGVGAKVLNGHPPLPVVPQIVPQAIVSNGGGGIISRRYTGGEDYELLLTCRPDAAQSIEDAVKKATGTEVWLVGRIQEEDWVDLVDADGYRCAYDASGWDHFAA